MKYSSLSVSLSENFLAVGAENASFYSTETNVISKVGAAYIFKVQENGNYSFIDKVYAPNPSESDDFGKFLYQSANLLAVGARYVDYRNLNNSGATYLYRIESNETVSLILLVKLLMK